jgi:succinate dehydrogenase / fumarate reductase iron-sulfur subunit
VLREHHLQEEYVGPRYFVHIAALEMNPLDTENRLDELHKAYGLGYCNVTHCCTEVCPALIKITENSIIPLKERVIGEFYDPLVWLFRACRKLFRAFRRRTDRQSSRQALTVLPQSERGGTAQP